MKKLLKTVLKICGGILLLGIIGFAILYAIYNKPRPSGKPGPQADLLAKKMLKAVNSDAYKNTRYLEWSFTNGAHHYKWDKKSGKVQVRWNNHHVHLNLNNPSKSEVLENGDVVIDNNTRKDLIATATKFFNNDSFWLVAPFKVMDKGTERSIVTLKGGSEALLVTYESGGTTPGDAYLWKLLPNGFPESYRMWVKIIPIGGLEATWDDWKIMENGLALPVSHKLGPMTLNMGNVRAYE